MKKTNLLNLLLLAVLCLGFVSCSDDDDVIIGEKQEESIVGAWVFLKEDIKVDSKTNNAEFTQPLVDLFVAETFSPRHEIIFREDGTFRSISTWNSVEIDEGKYTYKNGVLSVLGDNGDEEEATFSIKISGNTMTMESDYANDYPFEWLIEWIIGENKSFKNLDPTSIKVEKMLIQRIGTIKTTSGVEDETLVN